MKTWAGGRPIQGGEACGVLVGWIWQQNGGFLSGRGISEGAPAVDAQTYQESEPGAALTTSALLFVFVHAVIYLVRNSLGWVHQRSGKVNNKTIYSGYSFFKNV